MIHFVVYGHAEAQGSTRAFIPKGWSRPVITTASKKMKPWRQQITGTAIDVQGMQLWTREQGGVNLTLVFVMARPASLQKRFTVLNKKPDVDKLARCVLDALVGIAYEDDAQVAALHVVKTYGTPERLEIGIDFISHESRKTG
jgi:Holliday junction resolvase RusA-like endonuclease